MTVLINGTTGITTPGLTNDGSQTISTGTANGVTYLNGSKVLTSGSALVFDGTNLLVGTSNASGNSKGYFYANADTSNYLKVANVNAGSSAYAAVAVSNDVGNLVELGMQSSTRSTSFPANEGWIYASNGINIGYGAATKFYAGSAERARITSAGNFLVGTTDSAIYDTNAGLDVSGFYRAILTGGGGSTNYGFASSNGSGDAAMGLWGVNSASKRLRTVAINTSYTSNTAGSEAAHMAFFTIGSGVLSERARIDSSGNLLVGKTATSVTTVGSEISVNGFRAIANSGSAGYFYNQTSGTTGVVGLWRIANVDVGSITVNGSSTAYVTSSDYRLKEAIAPMTGALAKVALLKPVTYKWKADGSDGQGFIAHELAEVELGCVVGEKDAVNEDGSIKPQGIDTSFLVATLTAAIQEQQALIVSLQDTLTALTTRVTALEGN